LEGLDRRKNDDIKTPWLNPGSDTDIRKLLDGTGITFQKEQQYLFPLCFVNYGCTFDIPLT
jgi:archaellum component FlaF (FlaF/FlaG flagellin family)